VGSVADQWWYTWLSSSVFRSHFSEVRLTVTSVEQLTLLTVVNMSDVDNKSVDQNLITSVVGANTIWAVLAVTFQSFFCLWICGMINCYLFSQMYM